MGELRCVDGSLLGVVAILCRDKVGQPYDVTLALARDRLPFAVVGQRCGRQLADLAARVKAAREDPAQAECWPDPDDRFPGQAANLAAFRPGEREFFWLRSRDRDDLPGAGEVRCLLRSSVQWTAAQWLLRQRAIIEAWGDNGAGVRAVLTSAELVNFLDTVLGEPRDMAVADSPAAVPAARASWRMRGREPDGSARSRLPAVRAAARGFAGAFGGAAACRGDVRW